MRSCEDGSSQSLSDLAKETLIFFSVAVDGHFIKYGKNYLFFLAKII